MNFADLETLKDKILLGEPIKYDFNHLSQEIKLSNGRFRDYDVRYINADIAKIITEFQKSYIDFLKALEKEIGIKLPQNNELISFRIEKGSILLNANIFSEVLALINSLKNGGHKMIIIIVGILAFGAYQSWVTYLKYQIEKYKAKLQNTQNQAKDAQIQQALKILEKMLENMNMQRAANHYKESTRKILRDDEVAYINDQKITNKSNFENIYITNDMEEIKENFYRIIAYNFINKTFKIEGIGIWVNASVIDKDTREILIQGAKKQERLNLKIKIIKDKNSGECKEAYILGIVPTLFDKV